MAQFAKAAGAALQDACGRLGYICALSGEIASFAYGSTHTPTAIEAVLLMPGVKHKDRPTVDAAKVAIAGFDTGPACKLTISSSNTLSFTDTLATGKTEHLPIDISIASGFSEADIQPMKIIDGLQYASAEYALSTRFALWFKPPIPDGQTEEIKKFQTAIHTEQIDPLLRYMIQTPMSISNWHLFGNPKILTYCKANPESAVLWQKVGFASNDPIFVSAVSSSLSRNSSRKGTPVNSTANPSVAATPSPHMESSTSMGAPPPYKASPDPPPTSLDFGASPSVPPLPARIPTPVSDSTSAVPSISNPTRIQMLYMAAQHAINILESIRLPAVIFGSLACFMYGHVRSPNDVDILVLPSLEDERTRTIEEVKATLAIRDPERFFLLSPRDPDAGYKILYYRLSGSDSSPTPLTSCKVDLVYPGTLSLPRLPISLINWDEGLPLIPFSLLLLQKLQGWSHHTKAVEKLKLLKQRTDVEDLKGLFQLEDLVQGLQRGQPWADEMVFTWSFLEASAMRVRAFCTEFPAMSEDWRGVGFLV